MQRGSRINTIWPIWLVCPERRGAKVTGTVGLGDADELEDATCCFPRTALPVLGCPGCIACCTKVKVTGYLPTYLPTYLLTCTYTCSLVLACWQLSLPLASLASSRLESFLSSLSFLMIPPITRLSPHSYLPFHCHFCKMYVSCISRRARLIHTLCCLVDAGLGPALKRNELE